MVWGNNHAGGYFYSTKMLDFITQKKWCAILYQMQYICIHNIVQRIFLNKRSYKNEETIHFMGELSFGVIIMWVSVLLGCMECVFGQWAISSLLCIALAHYSHMKTIYMCYVSLSLFFLSLYYTAFDGTELILFACGFVGTSFKQKFLHENCGIFEWYINARHPLGICDF